jgi:glutathione S-transferase
VKLYNMGLAVNPRRVRMFLAEKKLQVEMIEINIPKGENLTPEFLAINPRGVVPTLVLDDGAVLDESVAICRYIESLHPDPNLMGTSPLETAQIESWQRHMEFDGLSSVALAFRNMVPFFATRSAPGNVPSLGQMAELVERGKLLTQHWLANLETRLSESAFVAGNRFTIADITAFTTIDFAKAIKQFVTDAQPNLQRWYAEIAARPSAKA